MSHYYEDQFDSRFHYDEPKEIEKTLIIASTPRCGSHFLGHALHEIGHFGFPLEYANPGNLKKWSEIFGKNSFSETLEEIEKHRTSANGVFSIKLHYDHLEKFGGIKGVLARYMNPYFVLLTRADSLKQAVSLAIARQTGVWISGQKAKNDNPVYDRNEINYCLKRTILQNASWKFLLESNGLKYIEVDFDSTVSDLAKTLTRITSFMEMPESDYVYPNESTTKKQSGGINKEWVARYIEESNQDDHLLNISALLQPSRKAKLVNKIFKMN